MSNILTDSNLSLALHSNHDVTRTQTEDSEKRRRDVSGICSKLRNDPTYRKNIINTVCLYASFVAMSCAKGQIGPSFLDLQAISGVGLEGGSGILTTMYVGYMAGAIVGGLLFDTFSRAFLLAVAKFIMACAVVAIPWCSIYGLMVFAFFFLGAMVGTTDAIANAEIQLIWGKDGRPFIQTLHFMYSVGIAVSPLITAIYMQQTPDSTNANNPSVSPILTNTSYLEIVYAPFPTAAYNSSLNQSTTENTFVRSPDLYKAYIITGSVVIFVFVMQISFYLYFDRHRKVNQTENESRRDTKSRLPLFVRMQALLHMAGILALICGIDDTLMSFLTTFCVKTFGWSKTNGSFLTSLTGFVVVAGRFLSIFLIRIFSPINLVGVHSVLTLLVFIGIYVSARYQSSLGLWIVVPIFGYAKAPIFACMFTWTDEVFMSVTGKISSMFFVVITASMAINPLILGILMENFSNLWFCYLFMGESVLLVLLFLSSVLLTKRVRAMYGTNYDHNSVDVILADNLLEKNNQHQDGNG